MNRYLALTISSTIKGLVKLLMEGERCLQSCNRLMKVRLHSIKEIKKPEAGSMVTTLVLQVARNHLPTNRLKWEASSLNN
jgi:hypothetical protein